MRANTPRRSTAHHRPKGRATVSVLAPRPARRARALGLIGAALLSRLLVMPGCGPSVKNESSPSCETVAKLSLPNTTVTGAQTVAAGAFTPPVSGANGAAQSFADLPAFCRITSTIAVSGSEVKTEVWIPAQGWNGDFQAAGAAFWGGSIPYARMREILRTGAATAGTNLGIEGATGPSFAIDHPEKLANLGNVPFHAMVEQAKTVVHSYAGAAPKFTFMDECGGGGSRDALSEVQRFPADLDAASSIGFTNVGTHHGVAQMWVYQATHKTPASYIPPSKYPLIHQAALDACDAKDGVRDGLIADPPRCTYDPAVLQCKGAEGPTCLTAAQVAAVRTIYTDPVHARTKEYVYGSMPPGSELGWEAMAGPNPYPFSVPFYRYLVFKDPNWDYKTRPVNFDADLDRADSPANIVINATNPAIGAFVDRGGKLFLLGGWSDHTLGPGNNVHYYESVVAALGAAKTKDSVRLFMVPGMDHCLGADYPTAPTVKFDPIALLKQWKATGTAPDQIVVTFAEKGKTDRRFLVCAYPSVAAYNGTGSVDEPANFSCRTSP
jgi:feruloyl esterase